jgi:hypothetical protein
LRAFGIRAVARNTAQVDAEATSAAESTPSLASASCSPEKASVAISSETVNPIPAMVPLPATAAQPTDGRIRPRVSRSSTRDTPMTATGLPTV